MHPSGENAPPPQFEAPAPSNNGDAEVGLDQAREQVSQAETGGESAVGKQAAPATTPPLQSTTAPPKPALPVPAQAATSDDQTLASASLTAADVNLIEKPWVDKTKSVVRETHDDPYKQKREISKLSVDYLKKRYNKVIPLEDTT